MKLANANLASKSIAMQLRGSEVGSRIKLNGQIRSKNDCSSGASNNSSVSSWSGHQAHASGER